MKTQSNILFRSDSNNRYYYSVNKNQLLLCHPLMEYYIQLNQNKVSIEDVLKDMDSQIELSSDMVFDKKDVIYYFNKFKFLEDNGYFEEINNTEKINGRLSAFDIEFRLSNSKQIAFEVTDKCNLNCKYCAYGEFYSNYDKRVKKNLNFTIARNMLDYLLRYWNSNLNQSHNHDITIAFYGGEPLVNFDLIDKIVSYAKKLPLKHNSLRFSMTTNGVLLKKYAQFLVENGFRLLISIDGNRQHHSYRLFRNGDSSYEIVNKNIRYLKNNFPDYYKKYVGFNTVIHNKNSVYSSFLYLYNNFKKKPLFSEISLIGIKEERMNDFKKLFKNVNQSVKEDKSFIMNNDQLILDVPEAQNLLKMIHHCSGYVFEKYNDLFFSKQKNFIPTATCIPFSSRIFVTVNGKILPCERIGHQYFLGFVDKDGVQMDFNLIANKYNEYFDKMRSTNCNKCSYTSNSLCYECIFSLNINDKSPRCKSISNYSKMKRTFSKNISFLERNPSYYAKIMNEVFER